MSDFVDFADFYRAVNRGRDPFPWQMRLARMVASSGWPGEIGIPTGLGKSSCIDIAVWALARQSQLEPPTRTAPTRIWYVVNRRLLVDSAYEHGCQLAALLSEPARAGSDADPAAVKCLQEMASALGLIGGRLGDPLQVTRLRGGAELGSRPSNPAQPALIFATVPMYASRLLFRGFGCSRGMSPVDAALAGTDSVVLLDEAHLARPLLQLESSLAECDAGDPAGLLPTARSRPVFVSVTATGEGSAPFVLGEEDLEHPVVRQRLDASKPTRLIASSVKRLVEDICKEVERAMTDRKPSAAVVFVNDPAKARLVFEKLKDLQRKRGLTFRLDLLTGRIRDREGDPIRRRLLDPHDGAPALSPRPKRDDHLVVVATQTLEVGADLDFDVLVTEGCGARALIQRLGRVNRLGEVENPTAAVVFAEDAKSFGVYGDEPRQVWASLKVATEFLTVDLCPRTVAEKVGAPRDAPKSAGQLLPFHLWEWAKTTSPPSGEAPPELFFDGFSESMARVSVAWRVAIPDVGEPLVPPLFGAESVEVPLWELKEEFGEDSGHVRLASDRKSIESVNAGTLRPGDQVILPSRTGRYDDYGWAPNATDSVLDISLFRPPGLPLTGEALRMLAAEGGSIEAACDLIEPLTGAPEAAPEEVLDLLPIAVELIAHLKEAGPGGLVRREEWQSLIQQVWPEILLPTSGPARLAVRATRTQRSDPRLRSDALDELSFAAASPLVSEHVGSVGELAGRLARLVGLTGTVPETLESAGRFHDLGKWDPRFQRWLDPKLSSSMPVAKSSRAWVHWESDRAASGWPRGGRHEELSRRIATACMCENGWEVPDPGLLLHLIVSHHGYGRPLIAPANDNFPTSVSLEIEGRMVRVSGDLSRVDWDQPRRFRSCCERYGYWGLALLEAILRQADHEISREVVPFDGVL